MAGRPDPLERTTHQLSVAADVYDRLELLRVHRRIPVLGRAFLVQEALIFFLDSDPMPAAQMAQASSSPEGRCRLTLGLATDVWLRVDDLGRRRRLPRNHRSLIVQEALIVYLGRAPELARQPATFEPPTGPLDPPEGQE